MIFRTGKIKGGCHHVIDSPATHAAQMIMLGRIGVEAGFAAGMFEFLDQARSGQQIQVAVDRAQADSRQSPPHEFV